MVAKGRLLGERDAAPEALGLTPAPSRSLLSHQPQVLQSGCVLGSLVLLSLLWQRVVTGAALESRRQVYMSSRRADCNRASLTRVHRQTYARLYPVLLVKQDGSTIHIRYREPRRMLTMPVDLDSLSPEERRARFRKREAQVKEKEEEEPELGDDFDVEQYKQFWTKK
ncbi:large ribosomal subunit protein mL55 isoform X2 [Physeter macrocephalus]|uniref:Large ribosomal subunit protein mL55 isoform X2 n=1 Tax=Physeter macrocephalus TaxID=9755 RepID=A0A9W2WB14_PHYMC|nr:39S ribosomal protein L55, mitochondrial isoform X2 [Physeter catodon]XP_054936272.1 39S ribosomal protein L55, mitochondrial isoform X2 [Physeter catodon]XP_054936274.1 39S ribosomal protein L55, mitochondrial isoform X2 [Physeter catodon]XP_054936278.1 39S ribosomal protein L55, mitochondrial isoform X2 [Physeter catodon]